MADLSEFMRHFNTAYLGYFNRRHNRVGHLYQGRFKAIIVDKDAYLSVLSRYIHLNPVRIKALEKADPKEKYRHLVRYRWSSLGGYLSKRKKRRFVEYKLELQLNCNWGRFFMFDMTVKDREVTPIRFQQAAEYLWYPMENHGIGFRRARRLLGRRWLLSLGFGLAVIGGMLVPLANLLVMPAAVAGATALWIEELRDAAGEGEAVL